MGDNPFKNMQIDLFKSKSQQSSLTGRTVVDSARAGMSVGRNMSAWIFKKRLESEGYDPITIDVAVQAVKDGRDPAGILAAAHQALAALKKQKEIKQNPPPIHGSAHWARLETLVDVGLTQTEAHTSGGGVHLGTIQDASEVLYWAGESHLLTVAPTRTGKGTMQIIPNLLRYKGSAVVLDPKGELAAATAKWRAANVGPVYILNPFSLEAVGADTNAFNPLDHVKTEQDATKLAEMVYPRLDDDRQKFFDNEAIGFLSAVILFTALYAPKTHCNFGTIRDALSSLNHDFYGLLKAMDDPAMPQSVRNAARNVFTKTKDVGRPRLIDSLSQHLRIWDTPGLRNATHQSDFDFKDLKKRPATVYLAIPFDELHTYSTFVQLIFAAALDAMLAEPAKPDIPVLFILDEFLALEPDNRFVSALRTHASAGVRLWFFLQDLPTLEQKYPTSWKSFLQVEAKTFFGTDDPHTAELISNYLGDKTVAYEIPNSNVSVGGNAASYSISDNLHLTGRKLMTSDEVIRFLSTNKADQPRDAIHFLRGVPPVKATLAPWFRDEILSSRQGNGAKYEQD